MSLKENKKEIIKAGSVILVQGRAPGYIYYLHSGSLEILSSPNEFEGLDPAIISSKSKRVGLIKEGMIVPAMNIILAEPCGKSVRAVTDCQVSRQQLKGGLVNIINEDPALSIEILSHLFRMLEMTVADDSKYTKFYNYLCRLNDNISLIYQSLPKSSVPDKLKNKSESLYSLFKSNKGELPEVVDAQFLISDNSTLFKKKYSYPGLPIQSIIDQKQCAHVKKFLQLDRSVFSGLVKEDPSILQNMIETISDNYMKVLDRIYAVHTEIDLELETLFGGQASWSSYLTGNGGFGRWAGSGRLAPNFINNFLALIKKLHAYYMEISGKKLVEVYPGPKKIHEYYMANKDKPVPVDENADEKHGITGKIKGIFHKSHTGGIYKNSVQQIFEFALIDKEFQKNFLKAINEFKMMKDPFNAEPEGRKMRKVLTKYYWDLFSQVFIRKQKESSVPPPAQLMMRFGFLDETLLEQEQLEELDSLSGINEEVEGIPVLFEEEFLTKVYKGEENPSISEMGLSYEAFRREEEKHKSSREIRSSAGNENVSKTIYEIEHRLLQTVGVCSGSTATAFPILTSLTMRLSPKKILLTKSKIKSVVDELKNIDYSVFYRETTLKIGEARELAQEEVAPIIILIPGFGTKSMLWQDLDGTNRRTRGRIVIPILFMGDLIKNMAHTFACFRWELNRTIKGGMWADPVEGGVTGVYFDYVNFYKKNSKLSTEIKEKISEKFKSIRTNRDRFADDYIQWVLYEKDGVMRLNTVVREMFYRNVPFKKEIRAKLETMPAFAEIAGKYKNVSSKVIQAAERRFKKYMQPDGTYPEKVQKFMDFLNS